MALSGTRQVFNRGVSEKNSNQGDIEGGSD